MRGLSSGVGWHRSRLPEAPSAALGSCTWCCAARGDLEKLLVLRHQVKVLSRGVRRPRSAGAIGCSYRGRAALRWKERWGVFVVAPRTLLRWHRELIRRTWTYRRHGPGRPRLDPETVDLIVRLGKENPSGAT